MKLFELAIGQRFEHQGQIYTKTTPMIAVDDSGKQIFIRRSAEVKLVVGEGTPSFPSIGAESQTIEIATVLETFDRFFNECKLYLDAISAENAVETREQAQNHLETAREQFIQDVSTEAK